MEALRGLWTGAGLEAVETREITVHWTFADFGDFWMTKVKVVPAQKYVRPGKRATDDGEWQFIIRRMESRARLPPSHRGQAVGAIAFKRHVCRT
jgi:hypothetical protein